MARHRNIRGKNFDEDYEGYDDVYGHSVEDDFMYGASPATAEQFLYRRGHHELSSYLEDIGEDDRNSDSEQPLADSRNYERPKLSDVDEARLQSCLDEIRNVVGDTTPEHVLIDAVVANKFDYERALDAILNKQETNKKTRIDSRTDPTVDRKKNNSQDAVIKSSVGGDSRAGGVHMSKKTVSQEIGSFKGQANASSFSNTLVANQPATGRFQSYYEKVAADKDLVHFNLGSSGACPQVKESIAHGVESSDVKACSSVNQEGIMQFYPKGKGYIPQGQMQSQLLVEPGLSMQAGGVSLAELPNMQESRNNAVLKGTKGRAPPFGQDLALSSGRSNLAASHMTASEVGKPLTSGSLSVRSKSGSASLADLAFGQGSLKGKTPVPCNVSLGGLASSQLLSSKVPHPTPSSATQESISLADLASGHHSPSSRIPQMNKQGKATGLKSTLSGNVSLSDLASSHLSSPPKQSLLGTKQEDRNAPSVKPTPSSGVSLSDLASSHFSSSPKQYQLSNKHSSMKTPGSKSTPSSGLSLADLASSHLSSSNASALGSLSDNVCGFSGRTAQGSGVSLADLATADQTTFKDPIGLQLGKKDEKQSETSEVKSVKSGSSKLHTRKEIKQKAADDQIGTLSLGSSGVSGVVDRDESVKPSVELKTPRVPPGFESFIHPPSHSRSFHFDENTQPQLPVSGIPSWKEAQKLSSSRKSNQQATYTSLHKPQTHSKANRNSSGLFAPLSTFGNALCHQCRTASAKAAAIGRSRVGYRGVQRRVLHKQFSFERQKSRQEEAKEESWREVKPFDFSIPSPDDMVKQQQQRAFVPLNQRPQRTDNTAELDSRLRVTHTVDDAATQITRLAFEGKDPKQGFKVKVEDTSKGKTPEGGGVAGGGGEGEMKVEGAGSRKGALSPTRLSESSSSRRSSRESLPNVCSEPDLQAYSSATSTPSRKEGRKASSIDIAKELEKRQSGKELLNLVVIGHVDAGKSTLMGHLLYLLGQVNQRVMHKYETESRKQGKASFAYAWVLDETEEERGRGITMDVGLTRFETTHRLVTLLDAPGHKDFIPNMITGAAQADAAILVVDATRGEFETGFESGGQTREHALLVRSLGVRQLVVGVNKLDTVTWSEERFSEIVKKLGSFLKQAGFKESDVVYIPCSGLTGENLSEKAKEPALTSWYTGPCLLDHIDKLKPPKRSIEQSMRLCVSDVFKGMGSGVSVSGKIETGSLQIGEKIMVMPAGENGLIKVITVHDEDTRWSCAGDHTTVVVTGVDMMNITIGSVICSHHDPIRATTRFQARVVIFNIEVPLTKGFPVLIHYQSVSEPAVIKKLVSVLHKSTGEVVQKKPKCLTKQMNAIIEIETSRPVCLELYKDYKELGRFMLRYGGSTIAAGVVTEFKN